MFFTRLFSTLILALLLPAAVAAQGGRRVSAPSSEPADGVIRGRVILTDGKPVTKAIKVTLKIVTGDHTVAYTDQQGLFEFNGLNTGAYTVEAEADRERELRDRERARAGAQEYSRERHADAQGEGGQAGRA